MGRIKWIVGALCLCSAGALPAQETLESLKFKFEVHLSELEKAKKGLDENYAEQLGRLEKKSKARGSLTEVLAIQRERELFRSGKTEIPRGSSSELARSRSIYDHSRAQLLKGEHRQKLDLHRKYASALNALKITTTKAGNIGRAEAVAKELAGLQKALTKLAATDPLWVPIEMRGRFHVDVDDSASIYVNGTKVHGAPINRSKSKVVDLKEGDRMVVSMRNVFAGVRFKMAFLAEDESAVVSFRAGDFRMFSKNDGKRTLSAERFELLTEPVAKHGSKGANFGFPNASEQFWGQHTAHSVVACTVTREMITLLSE